MTSRELIKALVNGENVPRSGLGMGHPHKDTWPCIEITSRREPMMKSATFSEMIWSGAAVMMVPENVMGARLFPILVRGKV